MSSPAVRAVLAALLSAAVPVLLVAYATARRLLGRRALRTRSESSWAALLVVGESCARWLSFRSWAASSGSRRRSSGWGRWPSRPGGPAGPARRCTARGAGREPSRTSRLTGSEHVPGTMCAGTSNGAASARQAAGALHQM